MLISEFLGYLFIEFIELGTENLDLYLFIPFSLIQVRVFNYNFLIILNSKNFFSRHHLSAKLLFRLSRGWEKKYIKRKDQNECSKLIFTVHVIPLRGSLPSKPQLCIHLPL